MIMIGSLMIHTVRHFKFRVRLTRPQVARRGTVTDSEQCHGHGGSRAEFVAGRRARAAGGPVELGTRIAASESEPESLSYRSTLVT